MSINWHLVREPLQSLSSVPETASQPSPAKLIQPLPKTLMNQNYQTDVQYYTVSLLVTGKHLTTGRLVGCTKGHLKKKKGQRLKGVG